MRGALHRSWLLLALACLVTGLSAHAQSTAFTYQGRLLDAGVPATGLYDFQFTLFDAAAAGNVVGAALIKEDVAVTNGLFTTEIDFGPGVFAGTTRWLAMGARAGANTGGFITLPMRQALASVPQSQFALVAGSVANGAVTAGMIANNAVNTAKLADGAVTEPKLDATLAASLARLGGAQTFSGANTFSGAGNSFTGSGAGLTALNAASLASGTVPDARLSANVPVLDRAAQTFTGNTYFTPASGGVGIGTTSPGGLFGIQGPGATMKIFDSTIGDNGPHGFIGQSGGLLQLGLHGTTFGPPPLNAQQTYKSSYLAMDLNGAVGTLERGFGQASSAADFRITLDDGNGLMKFGDRNGQMLNFWGTDYGVGVQNNTLYQRSLGNFAWYRGGQHSNTELDSGGTAALMTLTQNGDLSVPGNVTMKNIVGLNFRQGGNNGAPVASLDAANGPVTVDEIQLNAPGSGYILVFGQARSFAATGAGGTIQVFRLLDVTGAGVVELSSQVGESTFDSYAVFAGILPYTAFWVVPVATAGEFKFKTTLELPTGSDSRTVRIREHNLTAVFIPVRHGPVPP